MNDDCEKCGETVRESERHTDDVTGVTYSRCRHCGHIDGPDSAKWYAHEKPSASMPWHDDPNCNVSNSGMHMRPMDDDTISRYNLRPCSNCSDRGIRPQDVIRYGKRKS